MLIAASKLPGWYKASKQWPESLSSGLILQLFPPSSVIQFSLCCAGLCLFCRIAKHSNSKRDLHILNQAVCQRGKSWNNKPLHRSQTCGNHLRKEAMKARACPATATRALKNYCCFLAYKNNASRSNTLQ